ncbi:hypothetical protein PtA15_9A17 [Puccinia triticina]|uniref:Uncharacterized protein n=1 Tax=Puccinia triticina TaxID=208348 RepID=A0ABY7CRJ8_9BASI|nr:uncharacterized protein PtA15_1A204 [Puccinia triticina]XP_053023448.1 uncharacterized protein PtA15_9A17 [Puccinia triticina]WAQ80866.1 hypothetical protein PtA15_1A204 [Puccinia triticina]WAQ87893.1 hypothetical protein PtA15_9A17 [Puccinia triticina]WAR55186.1 hypothetical protein PtB15_4B806 [Puccinia triticina]WAR60081.1 hypothetical protein PtB15_9B18 [Puccinia triticina]
MLPRHTHNKIFASGKPVAKGLQNRNIDFYASAHFTPDRIAPSQPREIRPSPNHQPHPPLVTPLDRRVMSP